MILYLSLIIGVRKVQNWVVGDISDLFYLPFSWMKKVYRERCTPPIMWHTREITSQREIWEQWVFENIYKNKPDVTEDLKKKLISYSKQICLWNWIEWQINTMTWFTWGSFTIRVALGLITQIFHNPLTPTQLELDARARWQTWKMSIHFH